MNCVHGYTLLHLRDTVKNVKQKNKIYCQLNYCYDINRNKIHKIQQPTGILDPQNLTRKLLVTEMTRNKRLRKYLRWELKHSLTVYNYDYDKMVGSGAKTHLLWRNNTTSCKATSQSSLCYTRR
jgi:hypothetical protein